MFLCVVKCCKHSWDFVCICIWPCVCVHAVVFDRYLIRMSVRSGILGVGVVMHVFCLLDGRCVWCGVGVIRYFWEGECAGDGRGEYRLC